MNVKSNQRLCNLAYILTKSGLSGALRQHPFWACMGLGALSALALPPVDAWPVLFITVPLLLLVLEVEARASLARRLILGWSLGLGYLLAALHWIAFAFFVDAARDLWMMPFALGGLSAFLALFWAAAVALGTSAARRGFPLWLGLPVSFACLEWLRGNILTGFHGRFLARPLMAWAAWNNWPVLLA